MAEHRRGPGRDRRREREANEGLGALQQAHASLEQAQGALMQATEGSGQADVTEANGLLAQAVSSIEEVRQQVSAAISGVGGRREPPVSVAKEAP